MQSYWRGWFVSGCLIAAAFPRLLLICALLVFELFFGFSLQAAESHGRKRIWIDTDAACGVSATSDVDDCLAMALLLNDSSVDVVGISSVFGNAPIEKTDSTIRRLVNTWCESCPPVYTGAMTRDQKSSAASTAISAALDSGPLTVFALGPVTNIAAALHQFTGALDHHRFVAVAGTRAYQTRFRISSCSPLKMRDLNFHKDPESFEQLLHAGVSLTLMPFELAQKVTLNKTHVEAMSKVLPEVSKFAAKWLWFWKIAFGKKGFHPFDAVAVSSLFSVRAQLVCSLGTATSFQIRNKKILHVTLDPDQDAFSSNVTYCHNISASYADIIVDELSEPIWAMNEFQ